MSHTPKFHVRWEGGREVFTELASNVEYVRASAMDDPSTFLEYQPKTAGLPVLNLVRRDASVVVKRAEKKERREQRALRARGLA